MEKRIGTVTILIHDRRHAPDVNAAISQFADIVLCRQGMPFREKGVAVISLIVDGEMNRINALTGTLGRIEGVRCKAVVAE